MASAVPQQENDLPFFLHCGQRADGETAVCAESHQIRQIGRRQGGEKIAVDRSFSQSLQKGGLCGIGAVSGRAKHLPQQGLNGNKPILPCGKRDAGVAAVFAGDGRPHRSGQGVRQDHIIRGAAGGDLTEWVDGINEMLTKAGILKDGCQFENVAAFQHGELTCLLYPFDDVKLDIGKLALWRLQTHEVYGGTWLSDFVPNYLGGFIETPEALADKPDCPLIGADGNIFNLLGIASRTLREHGLKEQAKEMSDRVFASGSYGEALCIIGEYVNITDSELEHKNSLRQQLKATKPADPVKKQQTSKQQER